MNWFDRHPFVESLLGIALAVVIGLSIAAALFFGLSA